MREYQMFLGSEAGVFGGVRIVWLTADSVALEIGRRLLREVAGVDIWQGGRRVALLRKSETSATVRS
jgi:hypothetical protein